MRCNQTAESRWVHRAVTKNFTGTVHVKSWLQSLSKEEESWKLENTVNSRAQGSCSGSDCFPSLLLVKGDKEKFGS